MAQHTYITDRIAMGSAANAAALAAALDLVEDGVLLLGPNLEILTANVRATELLGHSMLRGTCLADLLSPPSAARLRATASMFEATLPTSITLPIEVSGVSLANLEFSLHPSPPSDPQATIAVVRPARGAFAASPDPNLTQRDYLTGLPTRATLAARLQQAEAHARDSGNPYAILFIDLDAFKQLNDVLGHTAGDCVLTVVAGRLQAAVRPDDLVVRYGGDEFVMVIRDISALQLARLAKRLRTMLAAPLEFSGQWIATTASIGRAFGDGTRAAAAVLDEADRAMYRAKASRRRTHPR